VYVSRTQGWYLQCDKASRPFLWLVYTFPELEFNFLNLGISAQCAHYWRFVPIINLFFGFGITDQGVIFIVDHRFYRVPPYICCENDRKRSIVVCAEIPEDFRTRFIHKRLLTSFCHSHNKYRVVHDKNSGQR
jgi:hypothetical protein